MDRLTEWTGYEWIPVQERQNGKLIGHKDCMKRLAEYEDTGLTPEQMRQIDEQFQEQARELMKYKRDEEQGLLLRMPCKVGDTVYVLVEMDDDGKYTRVKVDFIDDIYFEDNVIMIRFQYVWHDTTLSDIGKTVFLTREEAEARMAEIKEMEAT